MKDYLVYYHLQPRSGNLMQPFHVKIFIRKNQEPSIEFIDRVKDELFLLYSDHYSIQITDIKTFE